MRTNAQSIPAPTVDLDSVREFLMGASDEVRSVASKPARPHRPTQQSEPTVPVSQGISRDRVRQARTH